MAIDATETDEREVMTRTPHREHTTTDARGAHAKPRTWLEHGEQGGQDDLLDTFPQDRQYRQYRARSSHAHRRPSSRAKGRRRRGKSSWILPAAAIFAALCLVLTATVASGMVHLPFARSLKATPSATATPIPTATTRLPSMTVPQGAFATRLFVDASGNQLTYYLYGPDGYTPTASYPLLIVLHGGGERAEPSLTAAQNAQLLLRQDYLQAFATSAVQSKWPCFVVAAQITTSQQWVSASSTVTSYTLAPTPTPALAMVYQLIESLQQIYPMIDPNRIYIGGISVGGFGTWEALERWPKTFAAGWIMAGAGDPQAVGAMVHDPVWGFQGGSDQIVPPGAVHLMVQAVQASGGKACYTLYPGARHDIWDTVRPQRNPQFLAWLFSQTKAANPASPPLPCPQGA